ncbi:MAG: hypothetical protein HY079_11765 [Elusimicrobia bacterium]|nr:hypothetical protein [Elusimicrobiota bacterium]
MAEMSGFNKFMLVVMLGAVAYANRQAIRRALFPLQPLYRKPYVVVYGKDECGYCQATKKDLSERGIPFVWKRLGDGGVGDELIPRMNRAGLETGYFDLPVVDVNAEIMVRPETQVIVARYGG